MGGLEAGAVVQDAASSAMQRSLGHEAQLVACCSLNPLADALPTVAAWKPGSLAALLRCGAATSSSTAIASIISGAARRRGAVGWRRMVAVGSTYKGVGSCL